MARKVTLRDVAAMADVSMMTVSNYVNGKFQFMSEEEISDYVNIMTREFKTVFHKDELLKYAKHRVPITA